MPTELVIGLHLPLHTEAGQRQLRGVLTYAEQHSGLRLEDFCYSNDSPGLPAREPPWTGKVHGAVVQLGYERGVVPWIQRGGVPVANAGGDLMDSPVVSVFADFNSLVRTAVDHLHGLGYRNLAYVGYAKADVSRHQRRTFADELNRRGCKASAVASRKPFAVGIRQPFDPRQFDALIVRLVQTVVKPLAIFAVNDNAATAICRLAQELGFRVPDDVGVLGVGDTTLARISSPPVSTIRTPHERIGFEAARLVHQMIEGRRLARKNLPVLGEELIARASTVGNRHALRADMQRALELIRSKACEGARIADIAAELNMSARTFEIQFAAAVGHPVGEELRQVRLERAAELLINTDLSLTRVASLCGYNDSAYLSKLFHRKFNQTPSDFRTCSRFNTRSTHLDSHSGFSNR